MRTSTLLSFVLLLSILIGCQQSKEKLILNIPDPKTLNESYVSNPDKILADETVSSLNEKLRPLDQSGKAHIDVVFVKSIGDNVPKEIATMLFNSWKIGDKETNNGLLIFIVEDQHRIEFETGYGLEGILPDVTCYKIQQDYMIPYARQNDYDNAVKKGVDAVIQHITTENNAIYNAPDSTSVAQSEVPLTIIDPGTPQPYNPAPQNLTEPVKQRSAPIVDFLLLIILAIYIVFASLVGQRLTAHKGIPPLKNPVIYFLWIIPVTLVILLNIYLPFEWHNIRTILILYFFLWAYVNLHFYFLGKRLTATLKDKTPHEQYLAWQSTHLPSQNIRKAFPTTFLKSYWNNYTELLQTLRSRPMVCEKCGNKMILLSEDKDDQYLLKGNIIEEQIDSIDYDVWVCRPCKTELILDYKNPESKAQECSKCHFHTFLYKRRAIHKASTTENEGFGYSYYLCEYCKYEEKVKFIIPKVSTSSGSSSSSSSSSWSSSSGSSSSSSSSSSGGSSGGGGAGSSW